MKTWCVKTHFTDSDVVVTEMGFASVWDVGRFILGARKVAKCSIQFFSRSRLINIYLA